MKENIEEAADLLKDEALEKFGAGGKVADKRYRQLFGRRKLLYKAMDYYVDLKQSKQIDDYKYLLSNFTDFPQPVIDNPGLLRGKLPTDADIEWAHKGIEKYEQSQQSILIEENVNKCPTCNAPVKVSWAGLELVENSGDETLATKCYEYIQSIPAPVEDKQQWTDELIVMYAEAYRFSSGRISLGKFKEMIGGEWDKPLRKTAKELIKEWEESEDKLQKAIDDSKILQQEFENAVSECADLNIKITQLESRFTKAIKQCGEKINNLENNFSRNSDLLEGDFIPVKYSKDEFNAYLSAYQEMKQYLQQL